MSDETFDLLVRGIAAAKGNAKAEARNYLERLLRSDDADLEEIIEAWRYLAAIADDSKTKRDCLEQLVGYDPSDPEARRELAILDGRLNPQDIIDPDKLPRQNGPELLQPMPARRFVCITCGGKMAFTPDGTALTCAYCGRQQSLLSALDDGALLEQDFTVGMLTAKGHLAPVATRALKCQGCGASFVLSPQMLSATCPYCASAYVIEQTEMRELISPEGLVPFALTQERAQEIVFDWYHTNGFKVLSSMALPAGVYVPVWTFDVSGEINWNCLVQSLDQWLFGSRIESERWEPRSGNELACENDLRVVATHTLSAALIQAVAEFSLDKLVPYDERYLADFPAETYQVSVGDASLVARSRVLAKSRMPIEASITDSYKDLMLNTRDLVVESYKLILLPLWVARYHMADHWYTVVINGQTGAVRGEKPRTGVSGWFANLLGA